MYIEETDFPIFGLYRNAPATRSSILQSSRFYERKTLYIIFLKIYDNRKTINVERFILRDITSSKISSCIFKYFISLQYDTL